MSKRNIVKYTKELVRAGVLEEPLWMTALDRCGRRLPPAARRLPPASIVTLRYCFYAAVPSIHAPLRTHGSRPAVLAFLLT